MSGCDSEKWTDEPAISLLDDISFTDLITFLSESVEHEIRKDEIFIIPSKICFILSIVFFGLTIFLGVAFYIKSRRFKYSVSKRPYLKKVSYLIIINF